MATREDYIKAIKKFKIQSTRFDPFIKEGKTEEDFDHIVDCTYDMLVRFKPTTMAKMGQLLHNFFKQTEIERHNQRVGHIKALENVVKKAMDFGLSVEQVYLLIAPAHTTESIKKFSREELVEMIVFKCFDTYCSEEGLKERFLEYCENQKQSA